MAKSITIKRYNSQITGTDKWEDVYPKTTIERVDNLSTQLANIIAKFDDYLLLAGGVMAGTLNMGNKYITNLAAPTADSHAVNRKYLTDNYYTKTTADSRYAPSSHNHNDRYYTETESDNRYYTKTAVDNLLTNYSLSGHHHNDRYYLKTESDSRYARKVDSIYYVVGNTSGSAGTWTGSHDDITSLYAGLTIAYKIGVAGASTTNLNISNLGGKLVKRNTGNLTTHLPVGTVVVLTYDGTAWCWADYDSNSNYELRSSYYDLVGSESITRYKIIMEGADGAMYSISIGDTTGTTKTVSTQNFRINGRIRVNLSDSTYGANTLQRYYFAEAGNINGQYSLNKTSGYVAGKPIYLVGIDNGNGTFKLDNTSSTSYFTQTLPTSNDGKIYIYLGVVSTTSGYLRIVVEHPIYEFKDGILREYVAPHAHSGVYEPVFTKNTAFNKNFGTGNGDVARGDHTHNDYPMKLIRSRGETTNLTNTGTGIESVTTTITLDRTKTLMIEVNFDTGNYAYNSKIVSVSLGYNTTAPNTSSHYYLVSVPIWNGSDLTVYSFSLSYSGKTLYFGNKRYVKGNFSGTTISWTTNQSYSLYVGKVWVV